MGFQSINNIVKGMVGTNGGGGAPKRIHHRVRYRRLLLEPDLCRSAHPQIRRPFAHPFENSRT